MFQEKKNTIEYEPDSRAVRKKYNEQNKNQKGGFTVFHMTSMLKVKILFGKHNS